MATIQPASLLPYLPYVGGGLLLVALGCVLGYVFRGWLDRTTPSNFERAAKLCVAVPIMALYVTSCVWTMFGPSTYSTPAALHALMGLIVGTLFPKQFFRVGQKGFSFGVGGPDEAPEKPAALDEGAPSKASKPVEPS